MAQNLWARPELAKRLRLTLVVSQGEAAPRSVFELAEAAFAGGVGALQLREKSLSGREYYERAKRLAQFCKKHGKIFIVNDRLDLALASGAHGVHLGQRDLPAQAARRLVGREFLLGLSVGSLSQAQAAQAAGADYLGVGAIFLTSSKVEAKEVSLAEIKAINQVGLVSVAIGGIKPENAKSVWAMGFDGLAVISALTQSADPAETARALLVGAPED
ncbi:MAG: thiamine phosphate synthase [Deltaproteobacteria bacterium]|jgi:thiamine-phosphate pyrophosphorylase|nr:thiamine phosphate synthase [Deltaproteobacteria bacterium]